MAIKKKDPDKEIQIVLIKTGLLSVNILGTSPLVYNAVSQKAMHELLLPGGRKNEAEKLATLKHEPLKEYRNSTYRHREDDHPTRLFFPAGGFKKNMANTALRVPGSNKTEIGQLVWVDGRDVDIWGVPQIYMAIVRMADIKRTPDVRTRAILPTWACKLDIHYAEPQLNRQSLANLLANGGLITGVGDGRQEKGTFSNGQFRLVSDDNEEFLALTKHAGRKAQDRALANPASYDRETDELLSWYNIEIARRGRSADTAQSATKGGKKKASARVVVAASAKGRKTNGKGAAA